MRGIAGIDVLLRRIEDIGQDDVVARRRREIDAVLAGDDGQGQVGQRRRDIEDLVVEPGIILGIGNIALVLEEAGRAVRKRIVELERARSPLLEENEPEIDGQVFPRVSIVIPGHAGHEPQAGLERLPAHRLAEDHVDPAHVRLPPFERRGAREMVVDVVEPLEDLVLVLVFGRAGRRIPLFPEDSMKRSRSRSEVSRRKTSFSAGRMR